MGARASITALLVLYRIIQEPGFDELTTVQIGAPLALGVLGVIAFGAAIVAARAEPGRGARLARHRDEPAPGVENGPAAELSHELVRFEEALVDGVPRAVVQNPLLMLLRRDVLAPRRVDHHELTGHAPRLLFEPLPLAGEQMPVEVAR